MARNRVSNRRRFLQPLLMTGVVLAGVGVVAASLRKRPDIHAPQQLSSHYDSGFHKNLTLANMQITGMSDNVDHQVAFRADNLTIARRLSLALVGSGLSLEEVRALSQVPEGEQIRWWTSYLLEDRRWADYFAERFCRAFVGTDEGPFLLFRRRKFQLWLADQLKEGAAYDEIVRTMIGSEGLWTDTPQVNFITATMLAGDNRADPIRLAGRVSRAFLGQRIDCVQCHDDFLGTLNFGTADQPIPGTQEHFHTLAAFFAGTGLPEPVFRGIRENGHAYEFKYLGAEEKIEVEPNVPFSQELLTADGKPRERLAQWITHPDNRAFARATVNRVWALMFSRPLVSPVDNIPLDGSVPAVLDTLADDFATHDFDLRRLIRLIAETDAFQRDSRAGFPVTEAHEDCWAVFPLTQLRPEQVAGSLFQASQLTAIDSSSSILTQLKTFGDLQSFVKRFGDRGGDEFDSEAVTISQRLVMMNGDIVTERTKVDLVNNASSRIAAIVGDNAEAVKLTYLNALNRAPSEHELSEYTDYLAGKQNQKRQQALGDIMWALMNSTEFSWNH